MKVIGGLTNKNDIILPSLSGDGPPAMIVICHPVWFIRDSPIVASVRGNLSIALLMNGEFFTSEFDYKNHTQLPLKVSLGLRSALCWASLARLSIFFTTRLHLVGLVLVLILHKLDHNLEPVLGRPLLIWVFNLPLRFVCFPFLVDMGFPLFLVHQCLISLPILEHFRLSLNLEDSAGTRSREVTCIIMKPFSHTLHK